MAVHFYLNDCKRYNKFLKRINIKLKLVITYMSESFNKIYVWSEKFAILKAKIKSMRIFQNAFAFVCDKNEITVVMDQSKVDECVDEVLAIERDWKIITFDLELPFELVGFIAKISTALAEEGISIFVISAYSTDHILVKEKDLPKAIKKLEKIGFTLK